MERVRLARLHACMHACGDCAVLNGWWDKCTIFCKVSELLTWCPEPDCD